MRYSKVLTDFYQIKLSREKLSLVDAHFMSAAHHFFRSEVDDMNLSRFHQDLFWRHMTRLMDIISTADFTKVSRFAIHQNLSKPEHWNPKLRFKDASGDPRGRKTLFPDPHMFNSMLPDMRYPVGASLPYDEILDSKKVLRPGVISLEAGTA